MIKFIKIRIVGFGIAKCWGYNFIIFFIQAVNDKYVLCFYEKIFS